MKTKAPQGIKAPTRTKAPMGIKAPKGAMGAKGTKSKKSKKSKAPSMAPSSKPSSAPSTSNAPSLTPTSMPSNAPSSTPSSIPSFAPTSMPSSAPSSMPSSTPSLAPTSMPSSAPSTTPSSTPSLAPTSMPSSVPSSSPSYTPSRTPTSMPSNAPSSTPSTAPSLAPTSIPSSAPSSTPSSDPSSTPSSDPSSQPSRAPSSQPSSSPSSQPSSAPSSQPSSVPSGTPSATPSLTRTPSSAPTQCTDDSDCAIGDDCVDGECEPPVCFPKGALVSVLDGETLVPTVIEDLKVGDKVQCVSQTTQTLSLCTVIYHLHGPFDKPNPDINFYRKITYAEGESITLSNGHYMYRLKPSTTVYRGAILSEIPDFDPEFFEFPRADGIETGDLIAVVNDSNQLVVKEVLSNVAVRGVDAYAPMISDGGLIVVNGAVASIGVDLVAVLAGGHYRFSALMSYVLNNIIERGLVDASGFWGLTRDEPAFAEWYANNPTWLFQILRVLVPIATEKVAERKTLSSEQSLYILQRIMVEPSETLTVARYGELLAQAFDGTLTPP